MRQWVFCVLLCVLPLSAHATLNVQGLGALPVQHEGRIKPLEKFVHLQLKRIHYHATLPNMSAAEWLAQTLFRPDLAMRQPIFRVSDPAIESLLKLPVHESQLYAYSEITPALEKHKALLERLANKPANQYSATEQAIWRLYEAVDAMTQITGSLSLILPQKVDAPPALREWLEQVENSRWSYVALSPVLRKLEEKVKAIVKQKGDDILSFTEQEQRQMMLSYLYASLQSIGRDNHLLRVIPSDWSEQGEWFAPWAVLMRGQGSPKTVALLQAWQGLMDAYRNDDQAMWDQQLAALQTTMAAYDTVQPWRLQIERIYYNWQLIPLCILGYVLAMMATLLGRPFWATRMLGATLALHILAIITRMAVLGRPPIGTLYESVLFVALVAAWFGRWLAVRKSQPEGVAIGAGLGAFLLSISGLYLNDGDDGMGMLVAVLNTNFWLATHVVCITIGYGATLVAGTVAHAVLIKPSPRLRHALPMLTVIALLFTAIGTILGGIWADQSWGRFWGWDPKENGALLIVLWLVWLLHGRWAGKIGRHGFPALLGLSNIIVALSWFGVNLLNVGLHSYGFTGEAAIGLFAFCFAELLLVALLYLRARMRSNTSSQESII